MMLLGLELGEAEKILKAKNISYTVIEYRSNQPYEESDSVRVVRAVQNAEGAYNLTVCEFIKEVQNKAPQGV